MRIAVLAALLALAAATPASAEYRAAPGRVSFALPPEHPYTPSIEAVAALPGGAAIVAGTSGRRAFVARLRAGGGLDRAYGTSGVAYPDGIFVAGIAVASDGSVTVVMDARAGASPPPRLVRLDPRGEVDRGYGNGGRLDLTRLNGKGPVAATSEGGIVVAGTRDEGEGSAAVRVTPAGTVDGGFGAGARCRGPRPGRRTLAHAWVVFPRAGWQTAARVPARGHVTVRVAANDMAGNVRRRTFVTAVR